MTTLQQAESPQSIEELRERHRDLEMERVRAESDLRHAEEQLAAARQEARNLFGTDSMDELQAMLDRMRGENESRRTEYQQHLDAIEAKLDELETDGPAGAKPEDA